VGVGTTSPAQLLDVHQGSFIVRGYSFPPEDEYYELTPFTMISSNRIILQGAEQPYQGTARPAIVFDPGYKPDLPRGIELTSTGRIRVYGGELIVDKYLWVTNLPTTTMSANAYIDSAGRLCKVTSSRRYKEQIQPLKEDFTKILLLEPKQYLRRGEGPDREFGYIAEEVEAAGLKGLTVYDNQGRPDAVDYPRMVIYANEVLKQQQGTIQKQQDEIEVLKAELAELKKLIRQSRWSNPESP
jgi:hypothetical protein